MQSLQIKSVINATAFINKNQSGNKPWLVSWKVHRNRQLHVSFLLHVPSLGGFKGFRKLSLCSGLVLIGNRKQYKPANKQALGSGKWESKSVLAFIRFYKAVCRAYKTLSLSKLWREQWEIYGGKKWGNTFTWGEKSVALWKTARKSSFAKVTFSPCPTCLHLHFGVLCPLCFPAWFPCVGHHLQICVPPWCLRNSADTDSWQLRESQSAWLGHMGYNSPKTSLGNINAGKSDCEFPLSWLTPKNASLPPSLPRFCSDSVTSLQVHQLFLFPRALHGFVFWCTADTVCRAHFSTVSKSP